MLKIIGLIVIVVGMMMLGSGAPNTVKGYDPNELLSDGMMNMESNYYSNDKTSEAIFNEVSSMMGINSTQAGTNQKIADEKEAAQMKQFNIDAEREANGTMPICKEGESPLSKWMNTNNVTINEKGEVEFEPMFKSCMEPEEQIKGAIILFK